MRMKTTLVATVAVAGLALPALAQDSISLLGGLPGDALSPWSLTDQCHTYQVDLAPGIGSWPGTRFGIAPLLKGSKVNSTNLNPNGDPAAVGFFTSIISAQGISTDLAVRPLGGPYARWHADGALRAYGIGPNNAPPNFPMVSFPAGDTGEQFGAAFAEFSTDDGGQSYSGAIAGVVQYRPDTPNRLYVYRNTAAINESANGAGTTATVGFGSIDADGNMYIRSDDFSLTGAPAITGDSTERVRILNRNCTLLNQIVGVVHAFGPTTSTDPTSTDVLVDSSPTIHTTPGNIPASLAGGSGIGSVLTFNATLEYGPAAPLASTTAYRTGSPNSRGGVATTTRVFPVLNVGGGAVATQACLARDAADTVADHIAVWGVDPLGNVTGNLVFELPPAGLGGTNYLNDPCNPTGLGTFPTGVSSLGVDSTYGHYASQVAYNGGNGQVAVGKDPQSGELLVAACVYNGDASAPAGGGTGTDNPVNAIILTRLNQNTGAIINWELVAYIDEFFPFGGPPLFGTYSPIWGDFGNDGIAATGDPGEFDGILDVNPGSPTYDAPIGELRTLAEASGLSVFGPSMSAPSFDSMGNLYFVSNVALNKITRDALGNPIPGTEFLDLDTALIKAHYNRDCGGWRLERMLELGSVYKGRNSATNYQIQFITTADSNSISSGAFWSGNVMSRTWADSVLGTGALLPRNGSYDNAALGGMILSAEMVYDADQDGDFNDPSSSNNTDFTTLDESYNTALYIGYRPCYADVTTQGAAAGNPLYGVPDEDVTGADIQYYVNLYIAGDDRADITTAGAAAGTTLYRIPDGAITGADIQLYVNDYTAGCDNRAVNPVDPVQP